jgi:hypothetical protein
MAMRFVVVLLTVTLLAGPALAAGSSRGYGEGGRFSRYDPIVAKYNRSGELFRIEGRCQSACTLFLAIRNVCIDRNAVLAFHGANFLGVPAVRAKRNTAHMLNAYKPALQRYLLSHRYMATPEFHALPARELIERFGYRACPK